MAGLSYARIGWVWLIAFRLNRYRSRIFQGVVHRHPGTLVSLEKSRNLAATSVDHYWFEALCHVFCGGMAETWKVR
jgi:hypothetical protein